MVPPPLLAGLVPNVRLRSDRFYIFNYFRCRPTSMSHTQVAITLQNTLVIAIPVATTLTQVGAAFSH